MMAASDNPGVVAPVMRGDEQAPHEAACLRPFCCNPFGALSAALSAYAGVGGWTPSLPDAIGKDERVMLEGVAGIGHDVPTNQPPGRS